MQFPLVVVFSLAKKDLVFSLPEKDLVQDSADIIEKERDLEFKLRLVFVCFVLILLGHFILCVRAYVHHMCV